MSEREAVRRTCGGRGVSVGCWARWGKREEVGYRDLGFLMWRLLLVRGDGKWGRGICGGTYRDEGNEIWWGGERLGL